MLTITQDTLYTALGQFFALACPGLEVIRGQVNRTPMPAASDWAVIQSTRRVQTATTVVAYTVPTAPIPAQGSRAVSQSVLMHFQCDIYGPGSADNAQAFMMLFRSEVATEFFSTYGIAPVICDDPIQMPIVSGEQQWIERWMVPCQFAGQPGTSLPQDFADTVTITTIEVSHVE